MKQAIKQDYKGKGKSVNVAKALNDLAFQLNNANVPSGGTAFPTPTGFQIEVDNDAGLYHFEVVLSDTTHVEVRGGWWTYYEAEVPTQVDLSDLVSPTPGTITSYDDTTEPIAVGAAGVVYLELNANLDTLTPIFATDAAWAALVDTVDIFRKLIAEITWDSGNSVIGEIRQDWRGGNILWGLDETENDHSFHWYAPTLTISDGYYTQEGISGDYAAVDFAGITNPLSALPSVASRYYLKVTWNSVDDSLVDSVELLLTTGSTPTNSEFIWYFDVLSFDSDGVCTELMQGDLILPEFRIGDAATPKWNEVLDAATSVEMISDTTDTDNLSIGTSLKKWHEISATAHDSVLLSATDDVAGADGGQLKLLSETTATAFVPEVLLHSITADLEITAETTATIESGGDMLLDSLAGLDLSAVDDVTIRTDTGDVVINPTGVVRISGLPTASGVLAANSLFTQTAAQLGGTGSTKVICIV